MDLANTTTVVQGFGNAGSIAASLMVDEGSTVIGVSDTGGAIHKQSGLDIDRVLAWKKEHGTVVGFPGASTITNGELLELPCDILFYPGGLREPDHRPQRRSREGQLSSPRPPTAPRPPRPT